MLLKFLNSKGYVLNPVISLFSLQLKISQKSLKIGIKIFLTRKQTEAWAAWWHTATHPEVLVFSLTFSPDTSSSLFSLLMYYMQAFSSFGNDVRTPPWHMTHMNTHMTYKIAFEQVFYVLNCNAKLLTIFFFFPLLKLYPTLW